MGEKNAFTASLLQAGLFREYVLQALMTSFSIIQMEESDRILVGSRTLKWYDHVMQYKLNRYHYNETISQEDSVVQIFGMPCLYP